MSAPPSPEPLSFAQRHPLLAYIAEFRADGPRVALAVLIACIKHSPVFLTPLYVAHVLDVVVPRRDVEELLLCGLGMAAMIVMNMAMHPLFIRLYSAARRDVAVRLRARLCERLHLLVFSWHDGAQSGRLHNKVMADVEKLDQLGQILVDPIFVMLFSTLAATGIIVVVEPRFLIVVGVFIPIVLLQQLVFSKPVEKRFQTLRQEQEKLNAEVSEILTMLPLSRAHATEEKDLLRLGRTLDQVRLHGVRTDWAANVLGSQIWGTMQFVSICVLVFGSYLAIHGYLSVGEVVMFLSFVGMTIGSVAGILTQMDKFYAAAAAMRSIDEVLRHPRVEVHEGKPMLPTLEGRIEFDHVEFTYPGMTQPVLRGVNLRVEPHQTIALVGASGSGKSTLVKLLLGFYEPSSGGIRVDGQDLREVNLRSLRRQVGVVTQETFLFNGTILQNLTHGLEGCTTEDVRTACVQAHALEFIEGLEEGFETEIGDRGVKLSGGQKQRLAIARALLRKPRLLILDEATSALDSESERIVQTALETLMEGRTTFVIAHRLSTVRNADRILVFEDGAIVEDGTHEALIQREGVYARLVSLQTV